MEGNIKFKIYQQYKINKNKNKQNISRERLPLNYVLTIIYIYIYRYINILVKMCVGDARALHPESHSINAFLNARGQAGASARGHAARPQLHVQVMCNMHIYIYISYKYTHIYIYGTLSHHRAKG